eukprot:5228063-Pleurochrysis_carterae.AAC.1
MSGLAGLGALGDCPSPSPGPYRMPAASGGVHAAFTWATMSRGAATRLSAGSDSSYLQLSHSP